MSDIEMFQDLSKSNEKKSIVMYNLSETYAVKYIADSDKILFFDDGYNNWKKNDFIINPSNYQINNYCSSPVFAKILTGSKIKEMMQEYKEREERNKEREKATAEIKTSVTEELLSKHSDRNEVTESIVNFIQNNNIIHTLRQDVNLEMWIYDKNKGIYIPEAQSHIKEATNEILGKRYTTQFLNEIIRKIEARTFINAEELFKENPEEICVLNGVLNVRTKCITPFNPDKRFFSQIPVKFDPLKDCPKIKEFISQIVENKEDILLIQELLGYVIYKNYPIEKAFIFVGKGRNGKSQLIELIKTFVGIENTSNLTLQKICDDDSFDISELHNKLVNLGGDVSKETLTSTGLFKSLTGNDQIQAKRKFKSSIKFRNYAKMIFACNDLPRTLDHSDAFFERITLIVFPYRFEYQEIIDSLSEDEKHNVKPRKNDVVASLTTEDELSGLLNWALEGLNRLLISSHFSLTESQRNIKDKYIKLADSFAAFCSEYIEEAFDEMIRKEDIKKSYSTYCKVNKITPVSDKAILSYLTKELGAYNCRIRQNETDIYVWKNIRFVQGAQDDRGFSIYSKIGIFSMGVKTLGKLDTLVKTEENTSTSNTNNTTEKITEEPLHDPRIKQTEEDFDKWKGHGSVF